MNEKQFLELMDRLHKIRDHEEEVGDALTKFAKLLNNDNYTIYCSELSNALAIVKTLYPEIIEDLEYYFYECSMFKKGGYCTKDGKQFPIVYGKPKTLLSWLKYNNIVK